MPKRKNVHKVKTEDLQGEDSFVIICIPSVKKVRTLLKTAGSTLETFDAGASIIAEHVVEWNWVDNDGEPLPQPKDDPSVVDELTSDEYKRLSEIILGSEDQRKN